MVSLCACSAGPRNFENDNDRLRREVMELTEQNAALEEKVAGLEGRLAAAQAESQAGGELPPGVRLPRLSRVTLHAHSGGVDTNGDGKDDAVRLYVQTLDSRNRFIQTIATADVTLTAADPGSPAYTVATRSVDAPTFDASYRSAMMSTHYTLVVPVTETVPPGVNQLNAAIKITDLATGHTITVQKPVKWSGD